MGGEASRTACWTPIGVLVLTCALPGSASAFSYATTCGPNPGCEGEAVLHWEGDGNIPFRLHHVGSDDLSALAFEAAARRGFQAWASVTAADLNFWEEGPFFGAAEYHQGVEVDRESALFFIETDWPRAPEVIALTSVTFAEGGRIIEADIGFNGDDWTFTFDEAGAIVDLVSIATHEIGHFLGLDHSQVPEATMAAAYDEGETGQRSLEDDDLQGIAGLYPCEDAPCVGDVGPWSGCEAAGRGGPRPGHLLVGLALLGLFGRARRERRARAPRGAALLPALLLLAAPAESSTVAALSAEGLTARADLVVRGEVLRVESYRQQRSVWTRVELAVDESWKGLAPETLVIEQLGGRIPGEGGTLVFGAPGWTEGEEVVAFLRWPAGGSPSVVGLAQGKLRVEAGGALRRDLRGLAVARMGGETGRVPADLPALRELVRARQAP